MLRGQMSKTLIGTNKIITKETINRKVLYESETFF